MVDPNELITFELTAAEQTLLGEGLHEWGGPAYCTDALAVAMGFASVADLAVEIGRIAAALGRRATMTRRDWTRALLATEIVFASDVVGSGVEWPITTGLEDEDTIRVLRGLQRKLVTATARVVIGPRGQWRSF